MDNINKEIKSKFLESTKLRLKSAKDGKLRVGPEFVSIGVSQVCNFNCTTCWSYSPLLKKQIVLKREQIKIDKNLVFDLIDDLAQMKCIKILFSGFGEPFTHPSMMDFIKRTREKAILIYIQTNLSLVKDPSQLAKYLGSAANLVCVNLSAAKPDTYTKIHPNQKRKTFYEVLKKIRILKSKNVPIRLVYIVNKLNYQEIPRALELNEKFKTRLHLELMDYDPGNGLDKIALSRENKKELVQLLAKPKNKKEYLIRSNIVDFTNQLIYSALGIKKVKSCSIGYFTSRINESGKVKYCCNRDKSIVMGNLNEKSFKDIWNSKEYCDLRTRLLRGKFLDVCQNCIKKRGYNFKVRMFTDPQTRNFKLEEKILDHYSL